MDVTIHYERKYSDGNYGSEGLGYSLTYELPDAELTTEHLIDRTDWLRNVVLSVLAGSTAWGVSRAATHELNPPDAAAARSTELEDAPF